METKGHFKFVKMEHRIGKTIGDVVLIGDKRKVVVEVQMSPLSCQKMLDRMEEHKKHGFFTLWVVKSPAPIKEMEESAEKFGSDGVYWKVNSTYQDIHWILGGWLLFYNGDLHFTPAHLGGRRYVYHKFFFLNRDDIHLFKLVDREINEVNVVTVHENLKWWDKKNANKVSA
jgi:hypothetical protein